MAPEQAEGHSKQVGPAADIHALGAILYYVLTGRPPFLGESAIETMKLVASTEVMAPRLLRPDVPRDLETICLKCLEKPPIKRYASAIEVAEDLGRFQRGQPIRARRVGPFRRFYRWTRRHPWQTAAAATAVIATSAFFGLVYWHNVELRAEVKRTEARAAETLRGYQLSRSTIKAMLAHLGDSRFAGMPRLKELGRDQFEEALAFHTNILNQVNANDPAIRFDTAEEFGTLSTIESELGHPDQAERLVRQALELVKCLRVQEPENTEFLGLHVMCFLRLSVYLEALGRADEALATGQQAIPLAELLARSTPGNLGHQELVAVCHDAYGTRLRQFRRFREARDHYVVAIEKRQQLDPAKLKSLTQRHAETLVHDGLTLWNMNMFSQAEARFREVEELVRNKPEEQWNSVSLGLLYLNWSGLLWQLNRFPEAIERASMGLARVEPYFHSEPNDGGARDTCFKLHGNLALALSGAGRPRESAEEWARVIETCGEPVDPDFRANLALELARAGELDRSRPQARMVGWAPGLPGSVCYNMARYYSLCADVLSTDPRMAPIQQGRLVEADVSDALRWLRSAAEAGLFKDPGIRDRAMNDPDLEFVRGQPAFRQIIEGKAATP